MNIKSLQNHSLSGDRALGPGGFVTFRAQQRLGSEAGWSSLQVALSAASAPVRIAGQAPEEVGWDTGDCCDDRRPTESFGGSLFFRNDRFIMPTRSCLKTQDGVRHSELSKTNHATSWHGDTLCLHTAVHCGLQTRETAKCSRVPTFVFIAQGLGNGSLWRGADPRALLGQRRNLV